MRSWLRVGAGGVLLAWGIGCGTSSSGASGAPDSGALPSGDAGAKCSSPVPADAAPGVDAACGPMPALSGYQSACICADSPSNGLVAGGHCNATQLPGPALCCATAGWVAGTPGKAPSCVCAQVVCKQANDGKCRCNTRAPQPVEQLVPSCTGATCCRSRTDEGCTCGSTPCDDTKEDTVPTCKAEDVLCPCAMSTVPACN